VPADIEPPAYRIVREALTDRADASGFMVKDMAPADTLAAIRVVATGDALIAPGVTRRPIADFVTRPADAPERPTRPVGNITERGGDGKC